MFALAAFEVMLIEPITLPLVPTQRLYQQAGRSRSAVLGPRPGKPGYPRTLNKHAACLVITVSEHKLFYNTLLSTREHVSIV